VNEVVQKDGGKRDDRSLRYAEHADADADADAERDTPYARVAQGKTAWRAPGIVAASVADARTSVRATSHATDHPPPYRLVLLPSTCQLQRFIVKLLDEHKVQYVVSHSASGVAGLQLALKAGLGISCLNESSLGAGLVPCAANIGLPPLPSVEFHLLPARVGESVRITEARTAFARLLA
jgi:hypothetical protein